MVDAFNPVMLLTNIPVPVPSEVWESAVVGVWLVLQQTPRTVTVAPPSEVMFPPLVAEFEEMIVVLAVVNVGIEVPVPPLRQRRENPLALT